LSKYNSAAKLKLGRPRTKHSSHTGRKRKGNYFRSRGVWQSTGKATCSSQLGRRPKRAYVKWITDGGGPCVDQTMLGPAKRQPGGYILFVWPPSSQQIGMWFIPMLPHFGLGSSAFTHPVQPAVSKPTHQRLTVENPDPVTS
jgi:hypothetical protein